MRKILSSWENKQAERERERAAQNFEKLEKERAERKRKEAVEAIAGQQKGPYSASLEMVTALWDSPVGSYIYNPSSASLTLDTVVDTVAATTGYTTTWYQTEPESQLIEMPQDLATDLRSRLSPQNWRELEAWAQRIAQAAGYTGTLEVDQRDYNWTTRVAFRMDRTANVMQIMGTLTTAGIYTPPVPENPVTPENPT